MSPLARVDRRTFLGRWHRLHPGQQRALRLRAQGYTLEEAAALMGRSYQTIKNATYAAYALLGMKGQAFKVSFLMGRYGVTADVEDMPA